MREGARIHSRRATGGARGEAGLAGSGFLGRGPRGVRAVRRHALGVSRRGGTDRRRLALAVAGGALVVIAFSGCSLGSPGQTGSVRGASTTPTPAGPGGVTAVTPAVATPGALTSATGASMSLQAVTCVATADCWAVGWSTADATGQPQTLIAQGGGAGWQVLFTPPVPGSTGSELEAVSCTAPEECWAVGNSWQGSGTDRDTAPLIELETPASGWTVVSSPAPSGTQDSALDGVACAAGGGCWAVGYSSTSTASGTRSETLLEQETATGWSIVASPVLPATGTGGQLAGVACAGSDCWAVGHWDDAAGTPHGLIEQYAGSAWTIVPGPKASPKASPTPGRAATTTPGSLLSSVTCIGPSTCWSAGSVLPAKGTLQGLLEEYDGAGWSSVPAAATGSQLLGVACSAAGSCWAVGASTAAGSGTLIEQETAGGWSVVPTSPSSVTTDPQLNGVACVGSGECWAVGGPARPSGSGPMILEQMAAGPA